VCHDGLLVAEFEAIMTASEVVHNSGVSSTFVMPKGVWRQPEMLPMELLGGGQKSGVLG
jgi:hypothetical protein